MLIFDGKMQVSAFGKVSISCREAGFWQIHRFFVNIPNKWEKTFFPIRMRT